MTTITPPAAATRITATELARGLSDILNRVQYHNEQFVIERNGVVVAILGSLDPRASRPNRAATLAELAQRLGDLPPLDEDFEADIQAVRDMLPPLNPSRWE
jgi:hypothetical protein